MCRNRVALAVMGAAVAIALTSCTWTDETTLSATEGLPDVRQQLTAHPWLLDRADSSLTVETPKPITLRFGPGDAVSGDGACNTYMSSFTVDDDKLRVAPPAATKVRCPGTALAADREYLAALERVRDVDATDRDRLVLTASGVRLAFDAYDSREAILGGWRVTEVATVGDMTVPDLAPVTGRRPVLRITDDGRISVTGCNTFTSRWTLQGEEFTVAADDAASTTLMGCAPGLESLDRDIADALEASVGVEVTPEQLTLWGEDRPVLIAVRARG